MVDTPKTKTDSGVKKGQDKGKNTGPNADKGKPKTPESGTKTGG